LPKTYVNKKHITLKENLFNCLTLCVFRIKLALQKFVKTPYRYTFVIKIGTIHFEIYMYKHV